MIKKIIYQLCLLRNKLIDRDDFVWSRYHKNYANQIKENEKEHTLKLSLNDFKVIDNKLEFGCHPPLNNNAELLYQIIYDLNPKSICEVGCGGGDHMFNISKIMPEVSIRGFDLLGAQLDYLYERNPELKGKVFVKDITKYPVEKNELIFTQAVIMHIQKDKRHIDALINLFNSSNRYVVLMENWTRHNFYNDIQKLYLSNQFPWEELYIYKVDNGKQVAMVLSKEPIINKKLNYVELKRNEEMLKYLS